MDWRTLIYQTLRDDEDVASVIPPSLWYAASAFEEPPRDRPFGVIKLGATQTRVVAVQETQGTIWVYDTPGSYMRIDSALIAVGRSLRDVVPSGNGITIDVGEVSEDLYDDALDLIAKTRSLSLFERKEL